MFDLNSLAEPIVQAPMAGGPSTIELAVAVCEAGGLGFLAAGYKSPSAMRDEIAQVREGTRSAFGVNLFVPGSAPADAAGLSAFVGELAPEAERQGATLGEPRFDDDGWDEKLEILCSGEPVAVVSFAFGCPDAPVVARLRSCGIAVWVTVTSVPEAVTAHAAGADALVVQGTEAGGHRGAFTDDEDAGGIGLLALLRLVGHAVPLPLIATGGICDGPAVAAVLCAGASAAQIGTALMLTPEAGTNAAQRALMNAPIPTRLTRAFTGRLARGIVNRFMVEHSADAPRAYPEINHVTAPLRAAARARGDADGFNLWAGQAHELAQERPAGEIVRQLGAEARRVLRDAGERFG